MGICILSSSKAPLSGFFGVRHHPLAAQLFSVITTTSPSSCDHQASSITQMATLLSKDGGLKCNMIQSDSAKNGEPQQ
jgi:hypothetical protein